MKILNLPDFTFQVAEFDGVKKIFDVFRKKYVVLTPEEWVRQNFLAWLSQHKGYPSGLVAVETSTKYNKLAKRADVIIYGSDGIPKMIIEFKAPDVKISQDTFDQAARYNFSIKASYITITNGLEHFCCRIDSENGWTFLNHVPDFTEL